MTEMINVECANGQALPYIGCAVIDVASTTMKDSCLYLVVPDHAHSKSVSILLGTNNLERLFKNRPATELKDEGLQRVYQCITHRDRLLQEQGGVLAALLYQGHVKLRKYVSHPQTNALVERMSNPKVKELDVLPALHVLNSEKSLFISLHNIPIIQSV
ncbi:hypothetical protein PoB_004147000 [Plakobranchus ocellatus]|uniref:Uncharacterized protein n=1 Tax=Plakobranchus ocellatus TaxID=259542 RepID=A0AAV4B2V8_9GAST|nr:hypothetical protein PoB_004147000 [Plakobranchus ocellatus]